jgi:hypothetical protein
VIVNERLAKELFPNEETIGRVLRMADKTYEVVGIAKNSKSRTIGEESTNMIYLPLEQRPEEVMSFFGISVLVKTAGNPGAMTRGCVRR